MNKYGRLLLFLILVAFSGCNQKAHSNRTILIQPIGSLPDDLAQIVYQKLRQINPKTFLRKPIALPAKAYYLSRNRYRADSLIRILSEQGNSDTVVIGLITKDISTTKGNNPDWGIMGLAYRPGCACVVSTYRLSKTNLAEQLCKVTVHELGHTQGLPHCAIKTCLMRNAAGTNPLNEEIDFCKSCKKYLKSRGWKL